MQVDIAEMTCINAQCCIKMWHFFSYQHSFLAELILFASASAIDCSFMHNIEFINFEYFPPCFGWFSISAWHSVL